MAFAALTAQVLEFRDQRNWAQFHSLRNLIVSLNLEAGELLELTQWKSDTDMAAMVASGEAQEALRDECADVLIYLLLIAENAGIDLEDAARAKLLKNAAKYPVEVSYGSSRKYAPATVDKADRES
ncbi:MAG: nucleotide pyrophosphohydrolase [Candidatus Accumulibacter sp.]|uniref:nucleotide pyrophosphohydrolase n=1 Tax=Accumulibacter sp. TaxID=2053492 RepID=UPI0019E9CB0E|nr:nucleotide pyrophosphohydrolase [Accumulibacter sp.]MBE2259481.1 nucleotide pyrophosphohydrolase [Paracoccaceae bacterium]MCB1942903.1 nucleotide pyrophosphohydrolase [Accumulibacter sp.]MCP5249746.1 nucleotide pyrophosphohydrolase [Accumulibacter sp.]